jgi:RNA methyltransferase, TrmH family
MKDPTDISSGSNARMKTWRRCAAGEVRTTGRTLVAGRRLVTELAVRQDLEANWIVSEDHSGVLPGIPERSQFRLTRKLFKELDQFGTGHPILDVAIGDRIEPLPATLPVGPVLAIPVQDPVNVGALVRTAVGLGVTGIILLPGVANPFHPKAVRTSAGAVFKARLWRTESLTEQSFAAHPLLALEARGTPLGQFTFPESFVVIVGAEGPGLKVLPETSGNQPAEHASIKALALPMVGIESFNVHAAVAMTLYEWKRQLVYRERVAD